MSSSKKEIEHKDDLTNGSNKDQDKKKKTVGKKQKQKQEQLVDLQEFQKLQSDLCIAYQNISCLNYKLRAARSNLEEEKCKRCTAEQQRDLLNGQVKRAIEILSHCEDSTTEKLQFLRPIKEKQNPCKDAQSSTELKEADSTGSILSDLNCLSKSEDDIDDADAVLKQIQKQLWEKHKSSSKNVVNKQPSTLEKVAEFNSSDKPAAAAIKSRNDADTAASQIKSESNDKPKFPHTFTFKLVVKPETCCICNKRVEFGNVMFKCTDCFIICHIECDMAARRHPCN